MSDPTTAAEWPTWHYRAIPFRTIDGDTCAISVDCGFRLSIVLDIRIAGVNAPEIVGETKPAGMAARDFLDRLLMGKALFVRTYRDKRSFTRYVGDIFIARPDGGLDNVADILVEAGHAVRWEAP